METQASNRFNPLVPLLLLVALALMLWYFFAPSGLPVGGLKGTLVEKIALEPFVIPEGQIGTPKTAADLEGKVTFISFWATYCGPCMEELPVIGAIANRYQADPNVQVWTILLDATDVSMQDKVVTLFEQKQVALQVYVPSGPLEPKSLEPTSGIPAAILIGPDGKVAGHWVGNNPNIEAEVAALITKLQKP